MESETMNQEGMKRLSKYGDVLGLWAGGVWVTMAAYIEQLPMLVRIFLAVIGGYLSVSNGIKLLKQ